MTEELRELLANSQNPDALARLFEFAAAKLAEPLVFTDEAPPEGQAPTKEEGADAR